MAIYLLDTNILLRLANQYDVQHRLVTEAVTTLLSQGDNCYVTPQVLTEMWVVATRPADVNGLGWSTEDTHNTIIQLLERFPVAEESSQIFPIWLKLVADSRMRGRRTHDMRIVAVMYASKIKHILTLNPTDFSGVSDITVVRPQDIVEIGKEVDGNADE